MNKLLFALAFFLGVACGHIAGYRTPPNLQTIYGDGLVDGFQNGWDDAMCAASKYTKPVPARDRYPNRPKP